MRHLRNTDPYLDMTDIMIVSHVLSDPNSVFPHTRFTTYTKPKTEYEKRLREDKKREAKLKISDGL